jgi:biotin transporter BioY
VDHLAKSASSRHTSLPPRTMAHTALQPEDIFTLAFAVTFLAISAKATLPDSLRTSGVVRGTFQSLVIGALGIYFGPEKAALFVGVYVLIGYLGLDVLSERGVSRRRAGYVLSFPFVAYWAGRHFHGILAGIAFGQATNPFSTGGDLATLFIHTAAIGILVEFFILTAGTVSLIIVEGVEPRSAFQNGFSPYIKLGLVKAALLPTLFFALHQILKLVARAQ